MCRVRANLLGRLIDAVLDCGSANGLALEGSDYAIYDIQLKNFIYGDRAVWLLSPILHRSCMGALGVRSARRTTHSISTSG